MHCALMSNTYNFGIYKLRVDADVYLCMYVCRYVCVRMYVCVRCMYVCMCVCINICVCVCVYVCMYYVCVFFLIEKGDSDGGGSENKRPVSF
jgi:hypothetical protein